MSIVKTMNSKNVIDFGEKESGHIKIIHSGGYVARFTIEWDEYVGYDENDKMKIRHRRWIDNGESKTGGYHGWIDLDESATNIHIKVEYLNVLSWDVLFDKYGLELQPEFLLDLYGAFWNAAICTNIGD